MPGHKGKKPFTEAVFPYEYDLTELELTDDLHRAEHVLRRLNTKARDLWQAKSAYLLTNGSTAGNLIAIHTAYEASKKLSSLRAKMRRKGTESCAEYESLGKDDNIILISRNSHISVLNAVNLLEATYLCVGNNLYEDKVILPNSYEDIKAVIDRFDGRIALLVLTYPTYEGLYPENLEAIIAYAHSRNILVHIDAAHGAHLNFIDPKFNLSQMGADFFTLSLHKTLPAATSTAVLFQGKMSLLNCQEILDYYYDVFETSSPSYPLLLSIEDCLDFLELNKKNLENIYESRNLLEQGLNKLKVPYLAEDSLQCKVKIDPLKLTLLEKEAKLPWKVLLKEAKLYPEYSNSLLTLLILSLNDEEESRLLLDKIASIYENGYELTRGKLNKSLKENAAKDIEADEGRVDCKGGVECNRRKKHGCVFSCLNSSLNACSLNNSSLIHGKRYRSVVYLPLSEALGKVLAKDLYFYPPGVPLKLAGELLCEDDLTLFECLDCDKLNGLKNGLIPIEDVSECC